MDGIFLVDKPVGPSSFDVIRKLKKISGIKKIGHAGTLDPLASGLLVICFGRYTKLAGVFTDCSKVYQAEITLGVTTTTDDGEGEVIERCAVNLPTSMEKILDEFRGEISQRPPNFSAIKINGKRAYQLARNDVAIEIAERQVNIHELLLEKIETDNLYVQVHCSKGTYIRSLARDIGAKLGCGGHASMIRRISSSGFHVKDAIALNEVNNKEIILERLLTGTSAIGEIEKVSITKFDKENIVHGRPFNGPICFSSNLALAAYEDDLIAIMRQDQGRCFVARVI